MRGKPLTKDPEELAAIRDRDLLYDAITLIQQFTEGFSTITPEDLRGGGISALKQHASETADVLKLTPEELFTRQYAKEKKKAPVVSQIAVAEREEARTSIMIERLEALPGMKHYYKDHPIYVMITGKETGYLKYLNDLLEQKQPEGSTGAPTKQFFTFKGKHTPEQRNTYREKLISGGYVAEISREDFEYLFSKKLINKAMKQIRFLKFGSAANLMLRELVEDYLNPKLTKYPIANRCISFPGKPRYKLVKNTDYSNDPVLIEILK